MQKKSRSIFIITILFAYIIFQFLWWEVLLVRQATEITTEKQKIAGLTSTDPVLLKQQIGELEHKKKMRIYMIAGEGTVFLLLLLFGIYKVKKYQERETELAAQQKNFLLSVTHELKTPIAATKLQLQTIQKHQLGKEKEKELIENALKETERLNKLVDNVLLASRMETSGIILDKENVDLSSLVNNSMDTYFKSYLLSGELKTEIEPGIFLKTDPAIFPSVVINLVENAIKYSFDKAEVFVSLKRAAQKIILTVSDQGYGIENKEKELVFQRFYRVGSEEVRSTKGTGIGLYIVKQIVEAHGASIQVKDNQPKGAKFIIEF